MNPAGVLLGIALGITAIAWFVGARSKTPPINR